MLKYTPKIGDNFIFDNDVDYGFSQTVIYVDSEKVVTAMVRIGDQIFYNNIIVVYKLENPSSVKTLNERYASEERLRVYGVDTGSTVFYDDKNWILASINKVNLIGDKYLLRPFLIDVDGLNEYIKQNNPDFTASSRFVQSFTEFIYESDKNIIIDVVSEPNPRRKLVTPLAITRLKTGSVEELTDSALSLFNMDELGEIKNEKLRNALMKLTVETVKLGIENDSIGISKRTIDEPVTDVYVDKKGNTKDLIPFDYRGTKYNQVFTKTGEVGWANHETDEILTEPEFINSVLENQDYNSKSIQYVPVEDIDLEATKKLQFSKPEEDDVEEMINFEELIDEGLDELDFEEMIDEGLDELD